MRQIPNNFTPVEEQSRQAWAEYHSDQIDAQRRQHEEIYRLALKRVIAPASIIVVLLYTLIVVFAAKQRFAY